MTTDPELRADRGEGDGAEPAAGARAATIPSGELTRQGVPVSELDGVHPGLAVTAVGPDDLDEASEPEADAWIGRVLSNVYRVEQKIGEGGMGSVYVARHVHLQKPYAIKVLSASVAKHGQAVERLKQEAIASSSIEHDNIVDVVNFDRADDGSVFIVMELLKGESLHGRLGRGRMTVGEALPVAYQICAALGAAHARGIVHRDLKPENVFLAQRGELTRVKVLDFGISKVKSAEADGVRMTRTGQLVGTPLYMSPEQAKGEQEIDHRVDVYALGVMLYEMLSGAPPFDGRNYFELLWKHGNEPPPPFRSDAEVSPALEKVVLRALAKSRDDRYASMDALAQALEEAEPDVPRPSGGSLTSMPPTASGEGRRISGPSTPRTPDPRPDPSVDEPVVLPSSGSGRIAAIVGAIVLGLLVLGGLAWGLGDREAHETASTSPPRTVPPPLPVAPRIEPEPVPTPMPVPVPDLPAVVTVSFGGTPSGVEVREPSGRVLCVTPCLHDLPGDGPATLSFHRDGYHDESRTIVPAEAAVVELRMRPRRRAGGTEGEGLHLKTKL